MVSCVAAVSRNERTHPTLAMYVLFSEIKSFQSYLIFKAKLPTKVNSRKLFLFISTF